MGLEFRSTSDGRSTSGCGDSDFHAATVELDGQTSVGHYIPERAMGFLRESEELVREPQYYNIHSGGITPDGERDSVPGSGNGGRRPKKMGTRTQPFLGKLGMHRRPVAGIRVWTRESRLWTGALAKADKLQVLLGSP